MGDPLVSCLGESFVPYANPNKMYKCAGNLYRNIPMLSLYWNHIYHLPGFEDVWSIDQHNFLLRRGYDHPSCNEPKHWAALLGHEFTRGPFWISRDKTWLINMAGSWSESSQYRWKLVEIWFRCPHSARSPDWLSWLLDYVYRWKSLPEAPLLVRSWSILTDDCWCSLISFFDPSTLNLEERLVQNDVRVFVDLPWIVYLSRSCLVNGFVANSSMRDACQVKLISTTLYQVDDESQKTKQRIA